MTRGLRAAAAGMRVQTQRQDVHAHNLANAATPGFVRSRAIVGESGFARALRQAEGSALPVAQSAPVDISPGPVHETNSPWDVAIDGDGFFALQTDRGLRFTRDGRFQVGAGGELLSASGHPVMGRAGPITLPGDEFLISDRGQVFSDGQFVDEIFIAQFEGDDGLRREADGLLTAPVGPRMADEPRVRQGYVEDANVTVVREMAQMMSGLRAYEASAATLSYTDRSVSTLIDSALS